jgi:hypothetical protein
MFQIGRIAALILLGTRLVVAEDNQAVFQKKLSPLLQTHCASCHSGANPQNELSVATYETLLRGGKHGQALTPGSAQRSLLIAYVRGEKSPKMPLGSSLPDAVIAELVAAIDSMIPIDEAKHVRDEHLEWLLKPPKTPTIPSVKNQNWVRNPIDAFILSKLEAKIFLLPSPRTRALIRRLYFDLIGLAPHPEEVQRFVSNPDPEAYEKLIDQLLADPRYGERWGRRWLDLARYAESDGFAVDNERPTAWRYRDYVIRAFNQDKPYDLFIKEQLAGDELKEKPVVEKDGPERLVALGFLRMATWEIDATSRQQLRQDFLNEIPARLHRHSWAYCRAARSVHNH